MSAMKDLDVRLQMGEYPCLLVLISNNEDLISVNAEIHLLALAHKDERHITFQTRDKKILMCFPVDCIADVNRDEYGDTIVIDITGR